MYILMFAFPRRAAAPRTPRLSPGGSRPEGPPCWGAAAPQTPRKNQYKGKLPKDGHEMASELVHRG